MSRIIQPSVAKRIAFATWARKNHIAKKSSATYSVPDSVEVPDTLMVGAQIDGKAAPEPKVAKPKRAKARKKAEPEIVTTSPDTSASSTESEYVFNPVDYPQRQEAPESKPEE